MSLLVDEIDRVLDGYPHIVAGLQQLQLLRGDVSVIGPPLLPDDLPEPRRVVQRALFRAGHTTRVLFLTGDAVVVFMTGLPDEDCGMGRIMYASPDMETRFRSMRATFAEFEDHRRNST